MAIAPPTEKLLLFTNGHCSIVALLLRKVVFPVNVRLLSDAMIPPPNTTLPHALLCVNSVFPDRVMLALFTASAVPLLSWKEQLTSSVYCVDRKNRAKWTVSGGITGSLKIYLLLQDVKAKECILNSTILVKLRPTSPSQTTVALLPEEDSPRMVSLAMLAAVMFLSRVWSPGKNTIVVLEVKYSSASCAYSESVAQLVVL